MSDVNGNDNMSMSMPMPSPMSPNDSTYNNQTVMSMEGMAMHTSFFWGKDVVLLFAGWPGDGRLGMYILALAAVFLLAVGAEIMSVAPVFKSRGVSPASGALIHAVVYAFRMGFLYLIMLSVMSFNLGAFTVAVAGHVVGSFIVKYRSLSAVARAVV
ncbi:copper transporter 6-like [Primulina huaijiensis]|uniref:copper transporter 6-like n=1 Tax=Primulina huaijiensis TaxID=1492673 RepID=UPI003CC745F0